MKLELAIMAGAESKAWLADLTKLVERMEKLAGGKPAKAAAPAEEEEEQEETPPADEDDDFTAKKPTKAAKGKSFDEEEEEADFSAPPAKAAKGKAAAPKAKKYTADDLNDVCKAKAKSIGGKKGRDAVLKILLDNFETESVSEIKPEQYAECIALMEV